MESNESSQRLDRIERILEESARRQAEFEAAHTRRQAEHASAISRADKLILALVENTVEFTNGIAHITTSMERAELQIMGLARQHKELAATVQALSEKVDKLTETVDRVVEAQAHTDDRLNAFIGYVDRLPRN